MAIRESVKVGLSGGGGSLPFMELIEYRDERVLSIARSSHPYLHPGFYVGR